MLAGVAGVIVGPTFVVARKRICQNENAALPPPVLPVSDCEMLTRMRLLPEVVGVTRARAGL